MKRVLLHECVPHALRNYLSEYETVTAPYAGLAGYKNGALLKAAIEAGFDLLVTGDKTLEYEQNFVGSTIAIVALSANAWQLVKPHVQKIVAAVGSPAQGSIQRVDCGSFSRRRPKREGPALG